MEMDAASHTGVQNIRDAIIETVSYRAAQARYKIFIIDEVHMLSTSAFNALLKTLEEPPAHVKFLFATTEIRKVPVTVLSRCQRFDLRRIEPEVMIAHLQGHRSAGRRPDRRGGAGADYAGLRRLGPRRHEPAGSGHRPWRGRDGRRSGPRDAGPCRPGPRPRPLRGDHGRGCRRRAGRTERSICRWGPIPWLSCAIWAEVTHWLSVVKITPDAADDSDHRRGANGRAGRTCPPGCPCGR